MEESRQIDADLGDVMKGSWKSLSIGGVVIVLLTVVAYIPALDGGFVFDDYSNIIDNQLLRSAEGLKKTWIDRAAQSNTTL